MSSTETYDTIDYYAYLSDAQAAEEFREESRKYRKSITQSIMEDNLTFKRRGMSYYYFIFLDNAHRKRPFMHPDEVGIE